jgi:hypothetical protein
MVFGGSRRGEVCSLGTPVHRIIQWSGRSGRNPFETYACGWSPPPGRAVPESGIRSKAPGLAGADYVSSVPRTEFRESTLLYVEPLLPPYTISTYQNGDLASAPTLGIRFQTCLVTCEVTGAGSCRAVVNRALGRAPVGQRGCPHSRGRRSRVLRSGHKGILQQYHLPQPAIGPYS